MLQCVAVYCSGSSDPTTSLSTRCVVVCCGVMQCFGGYKVCCSVLQCVAVCCSVLQCVAVC